MKSITITERWGRNSWKCNPNNFKFIGGGRSNTCHIATPEENLGGKTFKLTGKSYVCRAGRGHAICCKVEKIKDRSGHPGHVTIAWFESKVDANKYHNELGW